MCLFVVPGSIGRFQGFARHLWSSKVSDSQGIWSSWQAALCSYMVSVYIICFGLSVNEEKKWFFFLFSWLLSLMFMLMHSYLFASFNQLDLPEYTSKDQLHERLMLAIHEGSEGFGFGWQKVSADLFPQIAGHLFHTYHVHVSETSFSCIYLYLYISTFF